MVLLHMFILHLSYQGRIQDIRGGGQVVPTYLLFSQIFQKKKKKKNYMKMKKLRQRPGGVQNFTTQILLRSPGACLFLIIVRMFRKLKFPDLQA